MHIASVEVDSQFAGDLTSTLVPSITANLLKIDLPKAEIKFQQIRYPARGYESIIK